MGLDEIKKKVTKALSDEEGTDAHLDKGADAINRRTGNKHADKVSKAREFLDGKVGDERAGNTEQAADQRAQGAADREANPRSEDGSASGQPPAEPRR